MLECAETDWYVPAHDEPFPPQTPQVSFIKPELMTPSKPIEATKALREGIELSNYPNRGKYGNDSRTNNSSDSSGFFLTGAFVVAIIRVDSSCTPG